MICSICKKGETSVVDSRPTEDGTAIRRRRLSLYWTRSKVVNLAPHTQSLLLLIAVPSSVGRESTTEVSPFLQIEQIICLNFYRLEKKNKVLLLPFELQVQPWYCHQDFLKDLLSL